MLRLEHGGFADGMGPVGELIAVIVAFNRVCSHPLIPWKGKVFALALEVVFNMTLCANQASHLLVACLLNLLTLSLVGFPERGTGDCEGHVFRIMAVSAADCIIHFRSKLRPCCLVEAFRSHFFNHTGYIRAFAGPACAWLQAGIRGHR